LSCLDKLSKNVLGLRLPAHPRVGDGKTATRQIRCFLGFGVKRYRFGKISLLAMRGSENRIQIKVIWIKLKCSLTFDNRVVNLVVGQIGGGGNVAGDRRYGIQFLSVEDKLETAFYITAEEWVQAREEVSRCRVGIELESALQFCIRAGKVPIDNTFCF